MPSCATYDDVQLVLRLYELRREERMREARKWFMASFHAKSMDEFNQVCPPGSEEDASFRMIVTYWDMASSFITMGVLQPEALFESNYEMLVVWERLKDLLPAMREAQKNPVAFSNLEEVSKAYIEWREVRSPGAHAAFAERIG